MASKELIEKVAAVLDEGIKSYQRLDVITEEVLSTILAALQETTERMEQAHDLAHAKAETVFAETSNVWRAMLNASPLGEQSE